VAKIQFRGLRGIGELFGLLDVKSVPESLNIEEGVTVTYESNEAIQETIGKTYRFMDAETFLAAGTGGTVAFNPYSAAPGIPRAHSVNSYLIGASFSISGAGVGDFTQGMLSLLQQGGANVIRSDSTAALTGSQGLALFSLGSANVTHTQLVAAAATPWPWLRTLPFRLPTTPLEGAGAGNELRFSLSKASGAGDIILQSWVDFWAAPPGIRCPWV